MKKWFLFTFWGLWILGLLCNKFQFVGGGLYLGVSTIVLVIGYVIHGLRIIKDDEFSGPLKNLVTALSFFIAFTLVGIIYGQQFWSMPGWPVLFRVIWPLALLAILVQSVTYFRGAAVNDGALKNKVLGRFLIPLILVVIVGSTTFFTSIHTFCKIYKPYTWEEKMEEIRKERSK